VSISLSVATTKYFYGVVSVYLLNTNYLKISECRFLGHFRPQEGKPALWELDSDYYLHVAGYEDDFSKDDK